MTAGASSDRYDEFFEPLSLALGRLAFAAMTLERAMLADLVQRRVFRDGAEEVFGKQLVTRLERKPAGVLLEALRELDYAPDLATEIAGVIDRRNHFVHHLFDDPEFIEVFAARDGIGLVVTRVEALVSDIHVVTMRLEPQVSAGAEAMFGRSMPELLHLLRETDPDDFGEGELRRQLEALRQIPDSLVSGPGSEEDARDPTSDSPEIDLVHRCFEALIEGDLAVLESSLAEDAGWRTVEEGATNCEGRGTIIAVMRRNLGGPLRGTIEETSQVGDRVIVGFRPERPSAEGGRPLDGGIAYMVVTIRAGQITELKGCAERSAAVTYATTGTLAPPEEAGVRPPGGAVGPPTQRVDRLVPFVVVAEVERSLAFYHQLGFSPDSVHEYRGRLARAALESGGAEVMFERGDPIDPERQGVLFYLYSDDLAALRGQLLVAGIEAGEIEDGSPGPRNEMRVVDPDGYVLMIAQNE